MSRVEQIEGQVKELRPEELAAFREWFAAFDAEAWDRQFEADVIAGKPDDIAERLFAITPRAGLRRFDPQRKPSDRFPWAPCRDSVEPWALLQFPLPWMVCSNR